MYAKCGALGKAQQVFDALPAWDAVCWTALIAGYVQHGRAQEALNFYDRMQREGFCPDRFTFTCVIQACGSIRAFAKGEQIHSDILKAGMLLKDHFIGSALVNMYAKWGDVAKAQQVFDELPIRNTVSWTALIAGYAAEGNGKAVLHYFEQMQCEGVTPNAVTFTCIVKACASIGLAEKGQAIHLKICKEGMLRNDVFLGTAIVDMYIKCGVISNAQKVFDELPAPNALAWTALITGYAELGKVDTVLNLFYKMLVENILPDQVTFKVVVNSCINTGLLDEGQMCFTIMKTQYGVIPTLEHYTCMVDLFSRAGHFDRALMMLNQMPSIDHPPVWSALLAACQKWGNVKLATVAFEHAMWLDEKCVGDYVSMGNIYVAVGMQHKVEKIKAMRVKNKAHRKQECKHGYVHLPTASIESTKCRQC